MVEYSVVLKRHKGSSRPNVILFRDEDREKAIKEMAKYRKTNGYSVQDHDGKFTIADILLVEQEPIVGAPVLSVTPYCQIFDVYGNRRKDNT